MVLFLFASFTRPIMKEFKKGEFIMTYKQIEAAREARLWVTQIIVPTAMTVVLAASIPEAREFFADKAYGVKKFITTKFKKK